ncbi:MAG: hypothetical protein ACRD8A_04105 [Candidatus Acidiferrales bacterium]
MLRRFLLIAFIVVAALPAAAQTISPVIVEYQKKANGKFQVTNDSDVPLAVVLEPESFTVDGKGKPTYFPLDKNVHLELSSTSFRLAPHQTYMVFYKASADHLPAWFTIYATVTGRRTVQGLELAIHLPHTVYLMTNKPLASSSVVWQKAEFNSANGEIEGVVSNHGTDYARVINVSVTDASGKKEDFTGFPLFPGQDRQIDLPWKHSDPPRSIQLTFKHFTSGTAIETAPVQTGHK